MDQNMQGSADTGTKDDTYDIIAVLYHALQGAENCELYADDAQGDQELSQFFERAGDQQRQLAEQAKQLLSQRLLRETQGGGSGSGSAFNQFGSGSSSVASGMSAGGTGAAMSGSTDMSGGSDMSSNQDRQGGGSAYSSGTLPNASTDDQSTQFGQSALGQGQRHNEMSTGGGGTSTF
ncbi:MAG: hypothetical protein AVDCRST_MAG31-942 [uncultured Sphingomonas sp.]|uniref:Uncharacterized protein n=1 Tax=uncultured Sphingomonas sp. TaxID=158754 RepID=A0A6J4T2Y2_9SPHN|nr:hypothetical protein [uncultured Sphingomonas sp.]CAA9511797.1 MAG: hypothetical protein AVDCRST_MAG31-942 [uncultured Sphingomonas sp.]